MKKGVYNVVVGVLGQVIILVLGIVVPRFVLQSYGDETNGLLNAIGQVFTYLALIEAGVGQAALQSLYGPVVRGEHENTNAIMSATQQMYRRLTAVYVAVVIAIALIYPCFVRIEETPTMLLWGSTYWMICSIVLIQGISNAVTFFFVSTLRQLLIADGRNYIIVNITTLIRVLTSVLRIILINARVSIVVLQLVYLALAILEAIIYTFILVRKYPWLRCKTKPDPNALKQRNAFVIHETCNVIFSSTDVLILSIFCDLTTASVYAIYNLVFSALNMLISQVHNGCFYILGQTYSKGRKEYKVVHDAYDTYYMSFVFALISAAFMLILPFISLYTKGVTNQNYIDAYLPLLFCVIQLLSCCRITSSNLIKLAGHAKQTIGRAVLEAVINLSVSIILVKLMGIYGVLLGTIAALLYRTNDMILYANRVILRRSPWKTYRTIMVNTALFVGAMPAAKGMEKVSIATFGEFFAWAAVISAVLLIVFLVVNSVVDRDSWRFAKRCMLNHFRRKEVGEC